ncbi:MAG: methyltransferase domain-containing protein [Patescibacteria group bacterium]|jgi:SAM-dependent methyltransferase
MTNLKGLAPKFGLDCTPEYVAGYKDTHLKPINFDYKLGYLFFLITDTLLDNYRLLDIGCGTAGYYRLAKNLKELVGLDYSKRMIATANELNALNKPYKSEFINSTFDQYNAVKKFDAILDNVSGNYLPHSVVRLKKIAEALNNNGLCVFHIQPPAGLKERLGILIKNRASYKITEKKFLSMVKENGCLTTIFSYKKRDRITFFLKKSV